MSRFLVEPSRPARIRESTEAPWLAVAAVCVGAFMGQLDASIVTLALPALSRDLHASLGAVEWVSLSYLLVLIGAVSAAGRLADVFGRKLLYTYGFVVFTLASLGCTIAPNLAVLIVMRVVQGLGAALLQANSVAVIRTSVAPAQLNRAVGIQGAAQALGLALGPAVGGLLIGAGGWRLVFFVNVPAGIVGVVMAVLLIPRTRQFAGRARFDTAGLATLAPGAALLLFALSAITQHLSWLVVGVLLALGIALLAGFGVIEWRRREPLIDLRLLTASRSFAASIASGLLAYLVLFGVLLVSPLYIEAALHDRPETAGLIVTVLPLALGLVAPFAGILADRRGSSLATTAGVSITLGAFVVGAVAPSGRAVLLVVLALCGVGLGLFTPANNAAIARAGRPEQSGMVSGVLNMTRGFGTALGVAVAATTYATAARSGPDNGLRVTMIVLAACALVAVGLCGLGWRERRDDPPTSDSG
ncbi:MAG: MFS transporter [Actinobacteria bacterium]|nr:MFS transporter [Actinomycetota bacterium]